MTDQSAASSPRRRLSVVVMTFNEAANQPRCLESVRGLGDEVLVMDSFSTDETVPIARAMDARVEQHAFDSYPAQRDRMIRAATHDWILLLDADEYLSEALRSSVAAALQSEQADGYWVNRLSRIGVHWIRHGNWYPDRKLRLFDRRQIYFRGEDPHDIIDIKPGGTVGRLAGDLLHYADADLASRFRAIDRHTTRAAAAMAGRGVRPSLWRMSIKPIARFLISYVFRRGFLDGYYGWFVAVSEAHYVWLREAKLFELHSEKRSGQTGSGHTH